MLAPDLLWALGPWLPDAQTEACSGAACALLAPCFPYFPSPVVLLRCMHAQSECSSQVLDVMQVWELLFNSNLHGGSFNTFLGRCGGKGAVCLDRFWHDV